MHPQRDFDIIGEAHTHAYIARREVGQLPFEMYDLDISSEDLSTVPSQEASLRRSQWRSCSMRMEVSQYEAESLLTERFALLAL